MTVSLWPYSQFNNGAVTDAQHQSLWNGWDDGVLPNQASNALQVIQTGSSVQVRPGRILITGCVVELAESVDVSLSPADGGNYRDIVVAYIDRSQAPWTYGVRVVRGVNGGVRPTLSRNRTGRYEVPLRLFHTAASGAVSPGADERVWLGHVGRATGPWVNMDLAVAFEAQPDLGPPRARKIYLPGGPTLVAVAGGIRRADGNNFTAAQLRGGTMARMQAEFRTFAYWPVPMSTSGSLDASGAGRMSLDANDGGCRVYHRTTDGVSWVGFNGFYLLEE